MYNFMKEEIKKRSEKGGLELLRSTRDGAFDEVPYLVQLARRVQSAARACPLMSAEGDESSEQSMKMPLPSRQSLVAEALPATRGRSAATHLAIVVQRVHIL